MKNLIYIVFLFGILIIPSCNKRPKDVLDKNQMENILVDIHIAEGIIDEYPSQYRSSEEKQRIINGVLYKNQVTKGRFDSSLVWYGAHLDQYLKIYDKVIARLGDESTKYSGALAEIEKSEQTQAGDSVNIWRKSGRLILDPALLLTNRLFEVKGDTNFLVNDSLVWRMKFINLPADSIAFVRVQLGANYRIALQEFESGQPDSTGWYEISTTLSEKLSKTSSVVGSVTLINRIDSILTPVYVDSISLIRYHIKESSPAESSDKLKENPEK